LDIRDVATCFFKVLKPGYTPSKKELKKILHQAEKLTRKGWTYCNLTNRIVDLDKNTNEQPDSLYEVVSPKKVPPLMKDNNIMKDEFYYHHELQRTPGPTKIRINNDGTIDRENKEFYLEMKEGYTLKSLTKYFHNKMDFWDKNIAKMNYGGFRKIIDSYQLDYLLFTIDAACKDRKNTNRKLLRKYSQLFDYLGLGMKRWKNAKNASTGKIVPYYKVYLKERG
jgi:hypothetical protein